MNKKKKSIKSIKIVTQDIFFCLTNPSFLILTLPNLSFILLFVVLIPKSRSIVKAEKKKIFFKHKPKPNLFYPKKNYFSHEIPAESSSTHTPTNNCKQKQKHKQKPKPKRVLSKKKIILRTKFPPNLLPLTHPQTIANKTINPNPNPTCFIQKKIIFRTKFPPNLLPLTPTNNCKQRYFFFSNLAMNIRHE